MIRKLCLNMYKLFLIVVVTFGYLINPMMVNAISEKETLGSLKQSLKELQEKDAANKNKKQKTKSEINAGIAKIKQAETDIMKTQEEMTTIESKVEHTNEEIEKLKQETESLMVLYQKLENENVYVSYLTGATSMTELIMRMDAINQLTDYNNEKLNSLEMYIKSNEKLKKELANYQVKLDQKIVDNEKQIDELRDELAELEEGAVTIQDEIKNMKKLIQYYEDMGCKDDQLLSVCVNITDNAGWLKPISKGRITSLYGYRKSPTAGASSNHKGVDIGVSEGTVVYPTANGVVGAIVEKSSCGGNMLYIWVTVNGKKYTTVFMHLWKIYVNVGDKVTVNTPVAESGGGTHTASKYGGYDRCTTGSHLHYGLASGGWYGSSKATPLGSFNSHTMNPPGYPGLYQWFYSRA